MKQWIFAYHENWEKKAELIVVEADNKEEAEIQMAKSKGWAVEDASDLRSILDTAWSEPIELTKIKKEFLR